MLTHAALQPSQARAGALWRNAKAQSQRESLRPCVRCVERVLHSVPLTGAAQRAARCASGSAQTPMLSAILSPSERVNAVPGNVASGSQSRGGSPSSSPCVSKGYVRVLLALLAQERGRLGSPALEGQPHARRRPRRVASGAVRFGHGWLAYLGAPVLEERVSTPCQLLGGEHARAAPAAREGYAYHAARDIMPHGIRSRTASRVPARPYETASGPPKGPRPPACSRCAQPSRRASRRRSQRTACGR